MATVTRSWTVVSWNVHGSERPPLERIAAVLHAANADVIALQEIRAGQAGELAERLGMHHHWSLKHHPYTPLLRSLAEGLAILSPHPLTASGAATLTPGTSRWTWRHRIVQWALVERPDHSAYRVYNLHLTPGDGAARIREARLAAEIVASHGGAPTVLAGDFNDDGDEPIVTMLPGTEPDDAPPTSTAAAPSRRIDHVLVPVDARDVTVATPAGGGEWPELSDHLPVTTTFNADWVSGDWTTSAT